jgi:predicted DNA-binding transcriptional regulator AlpA
MTTPTTTSKPSPATTTKIMTIDEVIAELRVPRATFYRWRQLGKGPKSYKLPNGAVRIRRTEFEHWLSGWEETYA